MHINYYNKGGKTMNTLLKSSAISILVGCLGIVGAVNATVIFSDDFDETDITGAHTNFNTLDNWNVTNGTVDAFVNGGFGLPCLNAGCLDMDGSTGDGGRITTKTTFNFLAGIAYELTIDYRGNARGGIDDLVFGFVGDGSSTISNILSTDDWTTASITGFSSSDWSASLFVETSSTDNIGPLLSKVVLEQDDNGSPSPIPESSILALLGLGMAGIGYLRRRNPA